MKNALKKFMIISTLFFFLFTAVESSTPSDPFGVSTYDDNPMFPTIKQ